MPPAPSMVDRACRSRVTHSGRAFARHLSRSLGAPRLAHPARRTAQLAAASLLHDRLGSAARSPCPFMRLLRRTGRVLVAALLRRLRSGVALRDMAARPRILGESFGACLRSAPVALAARMPLRAAVRACFRSAPVEFAWHIPLDGLNKRGVSLACAPARAWTPAGFARPATRGRSARRRSGRPGRLPERRERAPRAPRREPRRLPMRSSPRAAHRPAGRRAASR